MPTRPLTTTGSDGLGREESTCEFPYDVGLYELQFWEVRILKRTRRGILSLQSGCSLAHILVGLWDCHTTYWLQHKRMSMFTVVYGFMYGV